LGAIATGLGGTGRAPFTERIALLGAFFDVRILFQGSRSLRDVDLTHSTLWRKPKAAVGRQTNPDRSPGS
jgi:hypothetical protein